ncbi:Succinate dehydrogenase assembly factor 4, mitochondrial [Caenorhabditis elegans]|uniref:Succinate dehydrogenase assembly factor 4, mitochondrial n=1 Tax=Caenorhabditis elegans TaxID=6239 RepID=Q8MQG6_CAEEL|nr:Succinate dehydrogenase assembly factor 4, mitochondrial [Caenorhabditis elegans]CCD68997.1 Succinate dehydrogenase assembly factor 4, mitochondrial [Caenorhabditis elegans]|eukprot:NP_740875.1 Uncharacterized protein CELE_W02D3.12 [Caenorhabditis elegans]
MLRQILRPILNSSRRFADIKPKQSAKEKVMAEKTPKGALDKADEQQYEDPHLKKHPGGVNKSTGEVGGPAGPEPTRYGDWERKGRVSDF